MSSMGIEVEALADLYCRQLKLPEVRSCYRSLAREAQETGKAPAAFLAACLAQELEARRENRLRQRLKKAKFPTVKTLAEFDFTVIPKLPKTKVLALADGGFVARRENVVCMGPAGTGKSHVGIALGAAAIQAGHKVRFTTAVTLSQELLLAHQEARLPRYLRSWQSTDLVIIDEIGYIGLGPGAPLLFQFCADRYEKASLLLTSNLEFGRWTEIFGDPTLTAALLDRLTHHAHILIFDGQSYRFRQSLEAQDNSSPN